MHSYLEALRNNHIIMLVPLEAHSLFLTQVNRFLLLFKLVQVGFSVTCIKGIPMICIHSYV